MNAIDRKFAKTYDVPDAANAFTPHFQYTITVRHQGTVIAFAMDNKRRIFYAVLNMERTGVDSTSDAQYWDIEPKELQFPEELSRVGYRAAGVWKMPVVLENGTELPYGTVVQKSEKDLFASTTARLTESTPFQVLSDEKHIYVFRQAVGKGHPDNYAQTGKPPVDQTLLLDRFVYVGGELRNKLEVRYQRSREKDLPASRKDALGYEDLEKKAFYEPTQELSFIGNLQGGRFSVLLLPTHLPDVQRWQIFAHNSKTQRMDLFSIERAEDGLFNTKGTRYYTSPDKTHQQDVFERQPGECPFTGEPLIPIVGQEGFAESALKLDGIDDYIAVLSAYTLDFAQNEDFTIEVWLQVDASQLEEGSIVDKAGSEPKSPYAIRYRGDGKIVAFRSDGSNPPIEIVADNDIRDGKFHHVAFTKQGSNLSLFVDGVNVGSTQDSLQQNPT
ncbi:MAG TPA: LamG domain-containing protein, partial [Allocoleopsis sp.]